MDADTKATLHASLRSKVQEQLAQPLHILFDELDARLFDLAERSRAITQQHMYFDALRQLRLVRVDVETDFLQRADHALHPGTDESTARRQRGPLRLIEKDEQEETLHLESQTQRLAEQLTPALDALLARLSELASQPVPEDRQSSPISPRGLSRAFRTALSAADTNVEIRLIAFGLFGQHVLRSLEALYASLNDTLVAHGVLPDLAKATPPARPPSPPPIRRSTPRHVPDEHDAAPASAPASTRPPPGTVPDGNEPHLEELHRLMQARQQAEHDALTQMDSANADDGQPATLPVDALDAALGRLWTYEGDPLAFKPQLLASARELANENHARLSSENEDVVDLIGLLFARIRNDHALPAPLQAMLARLHVPFLRTALKDSALLHGASHPARELIDELGELAIGWCHSSDPSEALLKQVALTVEQLASHFQDEHPIAFAQAMTDLRQQLDPFRRRADLTEQRTIETAIGRERLTLARNRVAALLQQRLHQHDPMPWVRQLLRGPWSNHLVLTWLRNSESNPAFRQALAFVDELLWADAPRAAQIDPDRLTRACQTLPNLLREGLTGVTLHDSEIEALALRLQHFLEAQAQSREAPDFLYETDPTLVQSDFATQWKDSLSDEQPSPADIDPALLAKLRALPPGTWFEFRKGGDDEMERAKLCWTSPYTGNNLFVNRSGVKVQELAPEALAAEMESGLARLIDSNRLLERTLRALIDQLRQNAPAAEAS